VHNKGPIVKAASLDIGPHWQSWLCAAHRTKINGSDPPLTTVCSTYAAKPFLALFHPPTKTWAPGRAVRGSWSAAGWG
jgi:hypothetical protein